MRSEFSLNTTGSVLICDFAGIYDVWCRARCMFKAAVYCCTRYEILSKSWMFLEFK